MEGLWWGLPGAAGVGAAAWGLGRWRWARKTDALFRRLAAARLAGPDERFDPAALDGLPPPVARHLRQALPPGTPIIRAVEVMHDGALNLRPGGDRWRPFVSRQRVVTQRPGFVWGARVAMAPGLAVHVHDAYVDGEGLLEPAILGLVPLVRLRDRGEVARGELMRFIAEAAWYPTALLPRPGLRWTPIDDRRAQATLVDGDVRIDMTFHVGEDGLIDTIRAEDRGRAVGDRVVPTPWEGRMHDYQRRHGLLVPIQGEVSWITPEGRWPYWRGRITSIHHDPPSRPAP